MGSSASTISSQTPQTPQTPSTPVKQKEVPEFDPRSPSFQNRTPVSRRSDKEFDPRSPSVLRTPVKDKENTENIRREKRKSKSKLQSE